MKNIGRLFFTECSQPRMFQRVCPVASADADEGALYLNKWNKNGGLESV